MSYLKPLTLTVASHQIECDSKRIAARLMMVVASFRV